jgi:hypothetical protein
MDIPLDLFEKPIQRIKTTCDLMGISDEFETQTTRVGDVSGVPGWPRARPTKNIWLSTA